jgi:hypothetical protein
MAEFFVRNRPHINLEFVCPSQLPLEGKVNNCDCYPNLIYSFVITTGHMSGGHLDESLWMSQHPSIMKNAKAAIVCEHFGALEWKDDHSGPKPVYKPTGKLEPMWTMA